MELVLAFLRDLLDGEGASDRDRRRAEVVEGVVLGGLRLLLLLDAVDREGEGVGGRVSSNVSETRLGEVS